MTHRHDAPTLPRRTALAMAVSLIALAGTGGTATAAGGFLRGATGVGSGGTGRTRSMGPVTRVSAAPTAADTTQPPGGNLLVVNDVRFTTTSATLVDDEGRTRHPSDLKPGVTVAIDAGPTVNGQADASAVQLVSDLIGAIDVPFDAATGLLRVMGQMVFVGPDTALDGVPVPLGALPPGTQVEVCSVCDPATGNYIAARIDLRPRATHYKVRGLAVDVDQRARTFRVGTQIYSYAGRPRQSVTENQVVAANLRTVPNAAGQWMVKSFIAPVIGTAVADGTSVGVTGIAVMLADPLHFLVNGLSVDASIAVVTPAGAVVTAQSRVQVQGVMLGGQLFADRLEVQSHGDGSLHAA